MKEYGSESFDVSGDMFILTYATTAEAGVMYGKVSSKTGKGISSIKYTVTSELMKKWEIGADDAVKFMSRFAKFYTQVRLARKDLAKQDEYVFDADFAGTRPEAVVEKVEREWQSILK